MSSAITPEQKAQVAQWVAEGASLSEVQKRLRSEFEISLTYMDTRFLVDDLNLTVKDAPQTPSINTDLGGKTPAAPAGAPAMPGPMGGEPAPAGGVRVTVDKIVRPGSLVSGNVTFSDGMTADWTLDQAGRLGLIPKTKGYQPKPADVQEFQFALQDELARLGY
jgi:hypothetical protein